MKVSQAKLRWVAVHALLFSSRLILVWFSQFSFLCFPSSAAGGEIFVQCVADNDEAFTEKDVIRLAKQILTGVAFLHRNNVVHLDLKVSALKDCMTVYDSLFPGVVDEVWEGRRYCCYATTTCQCVTTPFPRGISR